MQHKVGDWVRIRQWDDMEAEYGMDVYGNILVPLIFTDIMRKYCGRWGKITCVYEHSYDIDFLSVLSNWSWGDEMLEPEFSFQYFEFTKYCIDCVIKDSATIIAPTISFDDLFSITS